MPTHRIELSCPMHSRPDNDCCPHANHILAHTVISAHTPTTSDSTHTVSLPTTSPAHTVVKGHMPTTSVAVVITAPMATISLSQHCLIYSHSYTASATSSPTLSEPLQWLLPPSLPLPCPFHFHAPHTYKIYVHTIITALNTMPAPTVPPDPPYSRSHCPKTPYPHLHSD